MRCEGWTRNGGAFSFGPVTWSQCDKNAEVMLKGTQSACDGTGDIEDFEMPACKSCWQIAIDTDHIEIVSAVPIKEETDQPIVVGDTDSRSASGETENSGKAGRAAH